MKSFSREKAQETQKGSKRVVFSFDERPAAHERVPEWPKGYTEVRCVRDGVERVLMIPNV